MLLLASVTLTVATGAGGGAVTVIVALPVLVSLVAIIDAVPGFTAVTTPADDTVATLVFELLQVTIRPVSTTPSASRNTAVACVVAPSSMLLLASVTLTVAAGVGGAAVTVIVALPVLPSLVAMMLAVPGFTAVTTPLDETVATLVLELLHVTVLPVSVLPPASRVTAVA